MIWESVALMTVIDLLIVAATAHLLLLVLRNRRALAEIEVLPSVWLAISGLCVIALLFLGDLFTMHALPAIAGAEPAMAAMMQLHLDWSWVLILVGVMLLVTGLTLLVRSIMPQLALTIDALRQARDEVRNNEQRFRDLAEVASDWVWETDAEQRVTYVSPGIHAAVGVPAEQLLGMTRREIAEKYNYISDAWERHFEDIGARRPFRDFTYVRERPDGSLAHITLRGMPVYAHDDTYLGYRGVGSDITEQVNARAELARSERLATIGQITSTVSHELRNPLGTIHASTEALRHLLSELPTEAREVLDRIERNVQRCTRIIGELLSFAQQRGPSLETVEIAGWLDAALNDMTVPTDVALRRDLAVRATARLDRERLHQAVENVVQNAVQSLGENAADGKVSVGLQVTDSQVGIAVCDDGEGMDAITASRIFEPLFSTRGFGIGLGMPLVKHIVEQHGGSVEVMSEPGEGTTVTLWLPITAHD